MSESKTKRDPRKILKKILIIFLIAIMTLSLATVIFLRVWIPFGGRPSDDDLEYYAEHAQNFSDGKFLNYDGYSEKSPGYVDEYSDMDTGKGKRPKDELPVYEPSFPDDPGKDDLTITWLGHSSIFLQIDGKNILFDPVFNTVTSPVGIFGPQRFSEMPMDVEDLPEIDIMIVTHDHSDHLDYKTVKNVDKKVKKYFMPLGVENHFERWGISDDKVQRFAWWEETTVGDLTVACTPSQHNSGRSLDDAYSTLWSSWVIMNDEYKIFESGDTGYGEHFKDIHEKYGDFDFVMTDGSQYNVGWHQVHMFPEESVRAAEDLGASYAMLMHWGAFVLSDHPWDEPPERYCRAAEKEGLDIVTPHIGETIFWEDREDYNDRWWRDYE